MPIGIDFVGEGASMGASGGAGIRLIRATSSTLAIVGALSVVGLTSSSAAGASGRVAMVTATTTSGGAGLLLLGGAVLLLGGVGFVIFTWTRRRRQPGLCAEQKEALELAERAVRYWEGARAHLEAVGRERSNVEPAADGATHASLVAKAVEGLNAAKIRRDQCQMDLIHCMASGTTSLPAMSPAPLPSQPFFTPGIEGATPTDPNPPN